ncbi:MAG: hypothetical protein Q7T36_01340 [Fluviicoccus sp.]|uniref:hypothetical protein n=1 Tax=Fluviicoccus sp. TaxID=2003552 RepID=UPI00271DF0A4|nr:hypothetical protein [Fluviicoccus sp.]MDO8329098.1 hypothetical protein [Fluviicoccus sp.]
MNAEDDYQNTLTNTLRKIGRNLLNYQRVEMLWKSQINISDVTVEIINGEAVVRQKKSSTRPQPMGWLAENHRKLLFSKFPEQDTKVNPETISITTSFRIEDVTLSSDRRKDILILVQERNILVHLLAETFDHTSKNDCIRLCAELDQQNARIIHEIEFLNNISKSFQDEIKEITKYLESESFINDISQNF